MKRYFILTLLTLIVGCVTSPDGKQRLDPVFMAESARLACYYAASIDLAVNPNHRQIFDQARNSIALLLAAGNFDSARLGSIISDLPHLDGIDGQVGAIVIGGVIALWDTYGHRLMDLDRASSYTIYIKPVAEAMLKGLDQGIASIPPPGQQ